MSTDIEQAVRDCIDEEFDAMDNRLFKAKESYKYDYDGKMVSIPRVTRIIQACNPRLMSLLKWANSLGFKHTDYTSYMNEVSRLGTGIHTAVERYIKEGKEPELSPMANEDYKDAVMNGYLGFKKFWDQYKSCHNIEHVDVERCVSNRYYGGTADMIVYETNGVTTLYDFKSSNHIQEHHFIQLAAYKSALEMETGRIINNVSILQIDKYEPLCTEYFLDLSISNNSMFIWRCTQAFYAMLYAYYQNAQIEKDFKRLVMPKGDK